jgi:hypothetical protein
MQEDTPLIPGLTRAEVAKQTGIAEEVIRRIELRFQIKLCIALHKDPATRHLVPKSFQKFLSDTTNTNNQAS